MQNNIVHAICILYTSKYFSPTERIANMKLFLMLSEFSNIKTCLIGKNRVSFKHVHNTNTKLKN